MPPPVTAARMADYSNPALPAGRDHARCRCRQRRRGGSESGVTSGAVL